MSEESDDNQGKGEATFAPGQDIFDTHDEELKTVGEYLEWLQKGVQFSTGVLYQVVVKLADFHRDQGLAHIRFMESLAEMLPKADEDDPDGDGPHLTVVE